ncbi:MAG: hypothetical protein ABL997_13385, partial [Planctomycetota bacterium]
VVRGGGRRAMLPVEELAVPLEGGELRVELRAEPQRWLQLVAGAQAAPRTVSFELADGSVVPAMRDGAEVVVDRSGNSPPVLLPSDVAAVVLDAGEPTQQRLEVTDDLAMHLRVR